MQAKDSIVARLTGSFVTDQSDASSINIYDLTSGAWSGKILEAAELPVEKLPEIRRSIDVVNEALAAVADDIGVAAGTPVVIGGGDGSCTAAGALVYLVPRGLLDRARKRCALSGRGWRCHRYQRLYGAG